jgi:hypothetical protein
VTVESVCLTLVAARKLREELFDYLSEQRDLVSGFTASDADGHGPMMRLQTTSEQVQGHADEVLVRTILERHDAERLIDRLKTAFAGTRLVYWIIPVAKFGLVDEYEDNTGDELD